MVGTPNLAGFDPQAQPIHFEMSVNIFEIQKFFLPQKYNEGFSTLKNYPDFKIKIY